MVKKPRTSLRLKILFVLGCTVLASCTGSREVSNENYQSSGTEGKAIANRLPDYTRTLSSLKGRGRAIISEPNNTERVTLLFSSNHSKSLVTIRNGLGIEGGELLTDGDTLLVYNKVDNYARRIPIRDGGLDRINKLASLNILDMIHFTFDAGDIKEVQENNTHYKLTLSTGTQVFVDKESNLVEEVIQPADSQLPYSKIQYEGYARLKEFMLPRRITIFGAEEQSKIALQVGSLELNPALEPLTINLPENIRIYNR